MPEPRIIVKTRLATPVRLPGTLSLPDGKQPIRLGSGTITSLISSGGMAIVYEIWNSELEVKRAVKLLHPDHSRESEERFYTEMKITAKLHHPNIVEIYGVGRWNELPFIEMERIEGVTLEKILSQIGSMPPQVCTAIGIMVGRALNYAHNQTYVLYGKEYRGIIHRDLKPGNIMVTGEGVLKLMDFGIARPINASIHTCEGTVVGTMQYLAPEQLDGSITDARSDIYSMGAVLYEILTGVRAFPEVSLTKLVPDKLANKFAPLEDFNLKIPPALCNLIHKCMRFEREKRVQNMLELLRALGSIHKSLCSQSPEQVMSDFVRSAHREKKIALAHHRRRLVPRVLWMPAAAAALVSLGLAAWLIRPFDTAGPAPQPSATSEPAVQPEPQTSTPVEPADEATVDDITQIPEPAVELADRTAPPVGSKNARRGGRGAAESRTAQSPPHAETASPPPAATAAAPAVAPEPVDPKTALVDQLAGQYGSRDIMALFTGEVERGHFRNGLDLYARLTREQASGKKASLFALRAARGVNDNTVLRRILNSGDINDGEFYLEKAQYLFKNGDLAQARNLLDRATTAPTEFLDQQTFRQRLLFGRALCASAVYDGSPGAETRKDAMAAWYEVKSLMRTATDHPYFRKADDEIRRVSRNAPTQ